MLLLFCCTLVVAAETNKDIVFLTDENFAETRSSTHFKPLFVIFVNPGCSHCKGIAPTWKILARAMRSLGTETLPAATTCSEAPQLCERLSVHKFPKLVLIAKNDTTLQNEEGSTLSERLHLYEGSRRLRDLYVFATDAWRHAPQYDVNTGKSVPRSGVFPSLTGRRSSNGGPERSYANTESLGLAAEAMLAGLDWYEWLKLLLTSSWGRYYALAFLLLAALMILFVRSISQMYAGKPKRRRAGPWAGQAKKES